MPNDIMKATAVICVLLLPSAVRASEVRISLLEESTRQTTNYFFDANSRTVTPTGGIGGTEVPKITKYYIRDRQLSSESRTLAKADEILYQCHVEGVDLVIVRSEYNSFANLLEILAAFAGHPVQVSRILVLQCKDHALTAETEITRKAASYRWSVKILR